MNVITNIRNKLENHRMTDSEKKRDNDLTEDWAINILKESNYKCYHCKNNVLLDWKINGHPFQFTFDRLDNTKGHLKSNCVISCWICNYHAAAYLRGNHAVKYKLYEMSKNPVLIKERDNYDYNHDVMQLEYFLDFDAFVHTNFINPRFNL